MKKWYEDQSWEIEDMVRECGNGYGGAGNVHDRKNREIMLLQESPATSENEL